jgi:ligand-binding SRPBCC domain-containing protein
MRHRFSISQWVAHPHEFVFAYFADPRNLPALMLPWQKTRIVRMQIVAPPDRRIAPGRSAPYSGPIAGNGSDILISFKPLPLSPIRLKWRAVISDFKWNQQFCDQQARGPFAFWKHCHYIRNESRFGLQGTMLTDEIFYEVGRGAGAGLAHRLFFSGRLEELFHYRQQKLAELLEAARKSKVIDEVPRVPPARETSSRNEPRPRSAS